MKYSLKISVVFASGKSHEIVDPKLPFVFGRAGFCDLQLPGKEVQPRHCKIGWAEPQTIPDVGDDEELVKSYPGVFVENISTIGSITVDGECIESDRQHFLLFDQEHVVEIGENTLTISIARYFSGKGRTSYGPLTPGAKNRPRGSSPKPDDRAGQRAVNRGGRRKD